MKDMQQTVELLKTKDTATIATVGVAVRDKLDLLYHKYSDREYRQMMGDNLADLDGAPTIAEYLIFLKEQGIEQKEVGIIVNIITI